MSTLSKLRAIIEDHCLYPVALLYVCIMSFGLGLILGGIVTLTL